MTGKWSDIVFLDNRIAVGTLLHDCPVGCLGGNWETSAMKYPLIMLVFLALPCTLLAQHAGGISSQDLMALRQELQQAGQRWLDGEGVDANLQRQLKGVSYDAASLEALRDALEPPPGEQTDETIDLYVTTRLIQPLRLATQDVVRQALPIVGEQYQRLAVYEKLPHWTDEELRRMATPQRKRGESDKDFRERLAEAQRLKQQMVARQRETQLHNGAVKELHEQYVSLLLRADQADADAKVLEMLSEAAKAQRWEMVEILSRIRSAAGSMTKEQAAKFYNALKDMWKPQSMTALMLVDEGDVVTSDTGNPSLASHSESPGKQLLATINALATTAKLPALTPPKSAR